jgi:hypothetical protein
MFDLAPLTKALHLPPEIRFQLYYVEDAGCWNWLGDRDGKGYGRFSLQYGEKGHRKNREVRAHRYQYEMLVGPIPDGLEIDHGCKNTLCVNPSHLEPVTHRVNVLRGDSPPAAGARKTHCPKGHPYSGENLHRERGGARKCRACGRLGARVRRYARILKSVAIAT